MARKVDRSDVVDHETYRELRPASRERVLAVKAPRRIHLGDHLTFLFENRETIRYQIQEMMLAEKIVKEAAIQHEIDTYNALLGGPGELGCSLLIEIDDPGVRKGRLREWLGLPSRVYVVLEGGRRVYASFDPEQVGEDRLSAVQYLKFDTEGGVPTAVGSDFPTLSGETRLTEAQREALRQDLSD